MIPQSEICAVNGVMSAGADCTMTLSDETRQLNLDQWLVFLEPDVATNKGAAICMSSRDYVETKTALQQACYKLGRWCTKEVKEEIQRADARLSSLQERVMKKKRSRK